MTNEERDEWNREKEQAVRDGDFELAAQIRELVTYYRRRPRLAQVVCQRWSDYLDQQNREDGR